MHRCRGSCRWCREEIWMAEPYYKNGGDMVHETCMEEYLLGALGVRQLARLADYSYEQGEDIDERPEDEADGATAGMVPILPGGQREKHFL